MFREDRNQVLGTECVNTIVVTIEFVSFIFDSWQPASCQQEMCINYKGCQENQEP